MFKGQFHPDPCSLEAPRPRSSQPNGEKSKSDLGFDPSCSSIIPDGVQDPAKIILDDILEPPKIMSTWSRQKNPICICFYTKSTPQISNLTSDLLYLAREPSWMTSWMIQGDVNELQKILSRWSCQKQQLCTCFYTKSTMENPNLVLFFTQNA